MTLLKGLIIVSKLVYYRGVYDIYVQVCSEMGCNPVSEDEFIERGLNNGQWNC